MKILLLRSRRHRKSRTWHQVSSSESLLVICSDGAAVAKTTCHVNKHVAVGPNACTLVDRSLYKGCLMSASRGLAGWGRWSFSQPCDLSPPGPLKELVHLQRPHVNHPKTSKNTGTNSPCSGKNGTSRMVTKVDEKRKQFLPNG